ncbi:MAG: YdcH family protein [Alphaproteobacteria bacterium]
MNGEAHLTSLETKHQTLETEIHAELNRPAPDQSRLTNLKREKLRIKEEIFRFQN